MLPSRCGKSACRNCVVASESGAGRMARSGRNCSSPSSRPGTKPSASSRRYSTASGSPACQMKTTEQMRMAPQVTTGVSMRARSLSSWIGMKGMGASLRKV